MINDDDFDCERDFEEEQANREDYRQMQEEEAEADMDTVTISATTWNELRKQALRATALNAYFYEVEDLEEYVLAEEIEADATSAQKEVCDTVSELFNFTDEEIEVAVQRLDTNGLLDEKNRTEVCS